MVAVYTNDFTGTSGNPPSDFTLSEVNGTGGTIAIIGGNSLQLLTTATNFNTQRIVLPSSNASFSNGEVLVSYNPLVGFGQMNVILRGSGAWAGDMPTNGYILFANMAGAYFELYRVNSSVATLVGVQQAYAWSTGAWYFTRFAVGGAVLKVKVWPHTDVEPAPWTYEVTDGSPYTTAGQFQLTFRTVSSAVRDMRLDSVGLFTPQAHASAPSKTGTANNATVTTTGGSKSVPAIIAAGVGVAEWSGDDSDSINLEIYAAVTSTGTAYAATVSAAAVTNVSAQSLVKTGVANNATVSLSLSVSAGVASTVGTANPPSISAAAGSTAADAQTAVGDGEASGVTFLLDENGDPVLDENGQPIEDGYALTVSVSLGAGAATSAGVSNAPSRSVAAPVGSAGSVGSAPQPSVTTVAGGGGTTNVNPAAATSTGVANTTTSSVLTNGGVGASAGTANNAQTTAPVQAQHAAGTGVAYGVTPSHVSPEAQGVGTAHDAQTHIDTANFVAAAPIPVNATAADAQTSVAASAQGITVVGTTPTPTPNRVDEPGQLVTVRDQGHTVSLKER